MGKTIKVNIGGTDYLLTGDNEMSVMSAAGLVNDKISEIKQTYKKELPSNTLTVLAALNLAENEIKSSKTAESDTQFLVDELKKIAEYLENNLK